MRSRPALLWILAATVSTCAREEPSLDTAVSVPTASVADSGFSRVADSAWVDVTGLTLVGFHPTTTNEQLERDQDLATVLDDFAYHIGTAMDSLIALGVTVQYRAGDTVWMRSDRTRRVFVRAADSANVGYVLTDATGNSAILYGVRTYVDLIEYVHEFKSTGRVRPR